MTNGTTADTIEEPKSEKQEGTPAPDSETNAADTEVNRDKSVSKADSTDVAAYRTRPTIKPYLLWISVAAVIGGLLAASLFSNVIGVVEPEAATIGAWVVVFATVAIIVRYLITVYVLTRTRYVVTETSVRHEFSLWFRHREREVPFEQLRAHELDQDRIQRLFGVGTVSVLTGGTNVSLGYIEFQNVPNPRQVRDVIRQRSE